jgi:acyl-CoA dehydrogenase
MDAAELDEILRTVRAFVRDRVVPLEAQIDREDEVPVVIRDAAKEMGLFGFAIPEAYGGLGLTMTEECRLVFELGYTTPALRSLFGSNNGIAGHVLLEGATDAQRQRWLPRIATGDVVAAFALTEPEAGSDPSGLSTAARRDGDGWVIDGAKRYITNAPVADVLMVFARTGGPGAGGISAFMVPADAPGLRVAPKDAKMGQGGAWTADVTFDAVHVGPEALVGGDGGVGRGWSTAMRCLAHGRIHIAALCVGMAGRLVDETVAYARARRQSGRPIGAFQLVQGMVADSVTDLHAGRAVVLDAARAYDEGSDRRVAPSVAKYFASEMVGRVADRAVQVHGGAGYMRGMAVERFYRDARLFRIYEGTSQIQQLIIARNVIGDAARG